MISEGQIEAIFNELEAKAGEAAAARAEASYLSEFRKSLKAILVSESNLKTIGEREAYAYSHSRYIDHLMKMKHAVLQDELHRARIKRCELMIEFWRSQESSRRAMGAVAR